MKELCVIMSIYKNDRLLFVREAIESIIKQTYNDFDLHIQIDGVVDDDILVYIENINYNQVIINKRSVNKGLAFSLNELLGWVLNRDYKYIARMDADDIAMPERFEKQVHYMKTHPEVDCLGTWAIEINHNEEEFFKKQMPESHDECLDFFKKRDCMIHPTVMFRRTYFEKAGLYPEDTYFGEDTMMWAKGFKAGCRFANVPEYLLKFRLDKNFFERRRGWKHAKSIFQLRRRVNKLLKYPYWVNIYALMYASAKLMPKSILNLIYKTVR